MDERLTDEALQLALAIEQDGCCAHRKEAVQTIRLLSHLARAAVPAVQPQEQAPHEAYADAWRSGFLAAQAVGVAAPLARQEPKPDSVYPVQPSPEAATARDARLIRAHEQPSARRFFSANTADAALSSTPAQGDGEPDAPRGVEQTEPFWCHEQSHDRARCEAQCAECAEDGVPGPQEPDSARVPAWDRNGMVRALVRLSKALGHKPGATVDASESQCVEAALIELAAERLAHGVAAVASHASTSTPVASHAVECLRDNASGVQPSDEWAEVERIRDLPEVDEALLNFKDDCTGDNAAMVVRAVMRATLGVPEVGK